MARAKATVRRLNQPTFLAAPGQRIGNKNMNRRNSMFNSKKELQQTLRVEVKKMDKLLEEWTSGENHIISQATEGCGFKIDLFALYLNLLLWNVNKILWSIINDGNNKSFTLKYKQNFVIYH